VEALVCLHSDPRLQIRFQLLQSMALFIVEEMNYFRMRGYHYSPPEQGRMISFNLPKNLVTHGTRGFEIPFTITVKTWFSQYPVYVFFCAFSGHFNEAKL
jgi:hypothetical protein